MCVRCSIYVLLGVVYVCVRCSVCVSGVVYMCVLGVVYVCVRCSLCVC